MQQPSEDKENKNPEPRSKSKSAKEAALGQTLKNDALQLDQLREELTCVVRIFIILTMTFRFTYDCFTLIVCNPPW